MSVNFATIKGLEIPNGIVTQITDTQGRVLWSAVKKATITLTGTTSGPYAEYKGTKYTYPSTFEAAVGDTISLFVGTVPSGASVVLNGQTVATGLATVTYSYTVVSDATIAVSISGSGMSVKMTATITEA